MEPKLCTWPCVPRAFCPVTSEGETTLDSGMAVQRSVVDADSWFHSGDYSARRYPSRRLWRTLRDR